jgi:hypothetical protein
MVVAARPDLLGAIIARLRASSDITALTGMRISAALGTAWAMPTHAIVLAIAGGPPLPGATPRKRTRIDVRCYGSTPFEAMRLWRQFDAVWCPGQEHVVQFRQTIAGQVCGVGSVDPEGGPTALIEPDTEWPFVLSSYLVSWMGVAL